MTVTEGVPFEAISDAGICAVREVEETKVVASGLPFHATCEEATKLVPVTVSVNAGPPAVANAGESAVTVGSGLFVVKTVALDVPPPGARFTTVTEAAPAVARLAAGTAACSLVFDTNVVISGEPFQSTVDEEMKPAPVTVRVKVAPPAVAVFGAIEEIVGIGFCVPLPEPPVPPEPPQPKTRQTMDKMKAKRARCALMSLNLSSEVFQV